MEINTLKDFVQSGNINFLIGSGLSCPYLTTLKNIERQLSDVKNIDVDKQDIVTAVLYREYFEKVMLPNREVNDKSKYDEVFGNYCDF